MDDSHPRRITSTKCRIYTVVSPDDGPIVARNMQRLISTLRINCPPSWFYLQDYTDVQGQRNIKKTESIFVVPVLCEFFGFRGRIVEFSVL